MALGTARLLGAIAMLTALLAGDPAEDAFCEDMARTAGLVADENPQIGPELFECVAHASRPQPTLCPSGWYALGGHHCTRQFRVPTW